jgi:hypothetical protein
MAALVTTDLSGTVNCEMIELMGEDNVPSETVLFRLLRKQKVQDAKGWFVVGNPLAHKRPTDVQAQLFPTVGYGKWFVQEMARAEAVVAADVGAYVAPFAVLDEAPGSGGMDVGEGVAPRGAFHEMPFQALQTCCKDVALKANGRKSVLVHRLVTYYKCASLPPAPEPEPEDEEPVGEVEEPAGEGQAVAAPQEYEEEYDDDLEDGGFVDHDPEELDYDCAQGGPGGTKRATAEVADAEAPTPARNVRNCSR